MRLEVPLGHTCKGGDGSGLLTTHWVGLGGTGKGGGPAQPQPTQRATGVSNICLGMHTIVDHSSLPDSHSIYAPGSTATCPQPPCGPHHALGGPGWHWQRRRACTATANTKSHRCQQTLPLHAVSSVPGGPQLVTYPCTLKPCRLVYCKH